jgi:hypothetical protein
MPLMRDVMVGFFGFSSASPFCAVPLAPLFEEDGGREATFSGTECNEEAVEGAETEGAGEAAAGFEEMLGGLLLTGAAMGEGEVGFRVGRAQVLNSKS